MRLQLGMEHNLRASTAPDVQSPSESEIIRLAQQGDAAAFERIYRMHSRRVHALCLRIAGDPAEAEDLTQDAFLQLFRKIRTFRGESSFSTWLHRMTVNIALMRFRRNKHAPVSLEEKTSPREDDARPPMEFGRPDLRLTGLIDRLNLQRAIDRLPQGYKAMFILHDIEGYDHNQIAGILGCSVGNSKSQLHKARERLRELLHEAIRNSAREDRRSARRSLAADHPDCALNYAKA